MKNFGSLQSKQTNITVLSRIFYKKSLNVINGYGANTKGQLILKFLLGIFNSL